MYGKYPAISIHEEKIHIHRLLFMYWNKSDIPKNYSIHHIDENKLNASKENLIMVQSSFHNSAHNTGKVPSENVRNAIIKLNHSRKGKRGTLHRPDVSYSKIIEKLFIMMVDLERFDFLLLLSYELHLRVAY